MTNIDSLPEDIVQMRRDAMLPLAPRPLWGARLLRLLVWLRRILPWCVLLMPLVLVGCAGGEPTAGMAGAAVVGAMVNNHHNLPDWLDLFKEGTLRGKYMIAPNIERGVDVLDLYGWVEIPGVGHTLVICRDGQFCTEFVPKSGINYIVNQLRERLSGPPWRWGRGKILAVLDGVDAQGVVAYFRSFGMSAVDALSLIPLAVWCEMDQTRTLCPRKGEVY